VSLTRLESRPSRINANNYEFYVSFDVNNGTGSGTQADNVTALLAELSTTCVDAKLLEPTKVRSLPSNQSMLAFAFKNHRYGSVNQC
jgi:hypothetical protein